jgi:uncharacterized protein YprB with RNaseH-like and TPR domain
MRRDYSDEFKKILEEAVLSHQSTKHTEPRILFLDVETLPNLGFFFDTYSDRAIALDFVWKAKALCTVAWKFAGEDASVHKARTPYDDKELCQRTLEVMQEADYVVWHFGEGFDRKFIEGRLFANGLPALPPVASIDTYKLAKAKWGRTLNSNKLDHLAKLMGLGQKNKTDAMLWVRCAQGDKAAMEEMALYNKQDVDLLEAVYNKLAPNVSSKMNRNLLRDNAVNCCKSCGSENIHWKGNELTASTIRQRFQCGDCNAWSLFRQKK